MKKKLIAFVLITAMLAMFAPGRISVYAAHNKQNSDTATKQSPSDDEDEWDEEEEEEYDPEKCGKNLKWSFNESNGTLTITGSGKMWDYHYDEYEEGHPGWVYNDTTNKYVADKVKKVVFNGNITSIGDFAFIKCKNLKTIQLPSTLMEIGEGVFAESGITELNLPASVSTVHAPIDNVAFWEEYYYGDETPFTKIDGSIKNINVDSANPYFSSVNGILYDKQKNTLICCPEGKSGSVTIPASVTEIASCAFTGCSGLTNITMPKSLTSIGDFAFESCSALTSINIPDSVNDIGMYAFEGCTNLTSIHLPESLQDVDDDLFQHCQNLKSVTIPNSVTSIGWDSFRYCQSITSLTVPNSVTFIGQGAFARCANLKSIIIPKSVKEFEWGNLADATFEDCDNLRDLFFTGSEEEWKKLTEIDESLFEDDDDDEEDEDFNILGLSKKVTIHFNYVPSSLSITSHPANVTAKVNDSVSFTVKAKGEGLTYQWYYKKAGQTAWNKWGTRTTATTTATANSTWDKMQVYCKVTDKNGNTKNSNSATITITGLKITVQPANKTVALGNSITLSLKAEGTGLTYQWYFKKAGQSSFTKWNGRTHVSETVTPNATWNGIQLYCLVKDSTGNKTQSNTIKVTVTQELKITAQPTNVTTKTGSSITVSLKASGSGLTYQWYFKKAGQTSWNVWKGRTHASETVAPNATWDGIQLYCLVKDSAGKSDKSNTVKITLSDVLAITAQPANVTTAANKSVTFTVKAKGTGLTYQWYYKKAGATSWSKWNGHTTASTTATSNSTWNGMQVRCIVKDSKGNSVTSSAAKITIK